jgi:hypothetical protein
VGVEQFLTISSANLFLPTRLRAEPWVQASNTYDIARGGDAQRFWPFSQAEEWRKIDFIYFSGRMVGATVRRGRKMCLIPINGPSNSVI